METVKPARTGNGEGGALSSGSHTLGLASPQQGGDNSAEGVAAKSGGYRVITAYFGPDVPVYLIALLSKGERANFSAAEVAGFKVLTTEIWRYWRRRAK